MLHRRRAAPARAPSWQRQPGVARCVALLGGLRDYVGQEIGEIGSLMVGVTSVIAGVAVQWLSLLIRGTTSGEVEVMVVG